MIRAQVLHSLWLILTGLTMRPNPVTSQRISELSNIMNSPYYAQSMQNYICPNQLVESQRTYQGEKFHYTRTGRVEDLEQTDMLPHLEQFIRDKLQLNLTKLEANYSFIITKTESGVYSGQVIFKTLDEFNTEIICCYIAKRQNGTESTLQPIIQTCKVVNKDTTIRSETKQLKREIPLKKHVVKRYSDTVGKYDTGQSEIINYTNDKSNSKSVVVTRDDYVINCNFNCNCNCNCNDCSEKRRKRREDKFQATYHRGDSRWGDDRKQRTYSYSSTTPVPFKATDDQSGSNKGTRRLVNCNFNCNCNCNCITCDKPIDYIRNSNSYYNPSYETPANKLTTTNIRTPRQTPGSTIPPTMVRYSQRTFNETVSNTTLLPNRWPLSSPPTQTLTKHFQSMTTQKEEDFLTPPTTQYFPQDLINTSVTTETHNTTLSLPTKSKINNIVKATQQNDNNSISDKKTYAKVEIVASNGQSTGITQAVRNEITLKYSVSNVYTSKYPSTVPLKEKDILSEIKSYGNNASLYRELDVTTPTSIVEIEYSKHPPNLNFENYLEKSVIPGNFSNKILREQLKHGSLRKSSMVSNEVKTSKFSWFKKQFKNTDFLRKYNYYNYYNPNLHLKLKTPSSEFPKKVISTLNSKHNTALSQNSATERHYTNYDHLNPEGYVHIPILLAPHTHFNKYVNLEIPSNAVNHTLINKILAYQPNLVREITKNKHKFVDSGKYVPKPFPYIVTVDHIAHSNNLISNNRPLYIEPLTATTTTNKDDRLTRNRKAGKESLVSMKHVFTANPTTKQSHKNNQLPTSSKKQLMIDANINKYQSLPPDVMTDYLNNQLLIDVIWKLSLTKNHTNTSSAKIKSSGKDYSEAVQSTSNKDEYQSKTNKQSSSGAMPAVITAIKVNKTSVLEIPLQPSTKSKHSTIKSTSINQNSRPESLSSSKKLPFTENMFLEDYDHSSKLYESNSEEDYQYLLYPCDGDDCDYDSTDDKNSNYQKSILFFEYLNSEDKEPVSKALTLNLHHIKSDLKQVSNKSAKKETTIRHPTSTF